MQVRELINELEYVITRYEDDFVLIKKRDDDNIADVVIGFDLKLKLLYGWVITLVPIHNIDEIAHQYEIYREMKSDLKKFKEVSGYSYAEK